MSIVKQRRFRATRWQLVAYLLVTLAAIVGLALYERAARTKIERRLTTIERVVKGTPGAKGAPGTSTTKIVAAKSKNGKTIITRTITVNRTVQVGSGAGKVGPPGPAGPRGATGRTGPRGATGATGIGLPGRQGIPGVSPSVSAIENAVRASLCSSLPLLHC